MKRWEKAINYKWHSGAAHTFLLYLDVASEILKEKRFETLSEHLVSSSAAGRSKFVAFYNRGSGIRFASEAMEREFLKFLSTLHPEADQSGRNAAEALFRLHRRDLSYAFGLFNDMLRISWSDVNNPEREAVAKAIESCFGEEAKKKAVSGEPFFSVVFEYLETITPPNCAHSSCQTDRDSLVILLDWARDREIRNTRNLIILTAESLTMVAHQLRSETNGIVPLKLYISDQEDRENTYAALREIYKPQKGDMPADIFGSLSAGMSRNAIISMVKEYALKRSAITPEILFEKKKRYIEEQSGGLLEIMRPLWGIQAIGGLHEHKNYIREVVSAMREKNLMTVPMGILLLGAPGTGKTVFAQAIAYEAGLPFVIMKNIREMWVGQSERNLDFSLELISAMAPVIVFVDEIDQQFQSRSMMWDNTGVNNRLQAQLFQFMSNTDLRGRVLWVAASNRPDLVDEAMLREGRFDEKIPFFPPSWTERGEILEAILHKMSVQAGVLREEFSWNLSAEAIRRFGWQAHWHFENERLKPCDPDVHIMGEEDEDEIPLSGAQIETIVRKAYTAARQRGELLTDQYLFDALKDFLPPSDIASYREMTHMAILNCNSLRFIPEGKWRALAARIRASAHARRRLRTPV